MVPFGRRDAAILDEIQELLTSVVSYTSDQITLAIIVVLIRSLDSSRESLVSYATIFYTLLTPLN